MQIKLVNIIYTEYPSGFLFELVVEKQMIFTNSLVSGKLPASLDQQESARAPSIMDQTVQ